MKVYLVGGAVRDQLLGYPVTERDWVVVGATPQILLEKGYQQVGREFPVFLHPKTREEYALARMERKVAPGYRGFVCDFHPGVSLEEDLLRRDLTINAMAMDEEGTLIDPYHGQNDLEARVLRHISPAFIEDPVRVLRVARFMARYHHLGFTLAEETRRLMYDMVQRGELRHLVAERVWKEWFSSLKERSPEQFILVLRSVGALNVVLPELDALFGIPSAPAHHPEIDSGIHMLQVLMVAQTISSDPWVRFAAVTHDLGKAATSMALWPSHPEHGEKGVTILAALCERLRIPTDYGHFAKQVSRFHVMIHRVFELSSEVIVTLLEQVDAFRRELLFEKLLLVCEADALGSGQRNSYPQASYWRDLLRECVKIKAPFFVAAGYQGANIALAMHQHRVAAVERFLIGSHHEK